jgi:hypothetical protein
MSNTVWVWHSNEWVELFENYRRHYSSIDREKGINRVYFDDSLIYDEKPDFIPVVYGKRAFVTYRKKIEIISDMEVESSTFSTDDILHVEDDDWDDIRHNAVKFKITIKVEDVQGWNLDEITHICSFCEEVTACIPASQDMDIACCNLCGRPGRFIPIGDWLDNNRWFKIPVAGEVHSSRFNK